MAFGCLEDFGILNQRNQENQSSDGVGNGNRWAWLGERRGIKGSPVEVDKEAKIMFAYDMDLCYIFSIGPICLTNGF